MTRPFQDHRAAAMAVLKSGAELRPKEGQFLGGIAFDANPLTDRQRHWLEKLLERHSSPPLARYKPELMATRGNA
jgi:hypothetical protein